MHGVLRLMFEMGRKQTQTANVANGWKADTTCSLGRSTESCGRGSSEQLEGPRDDPEVDATVLQTLIARNCDVPQRVAVGDACLEGR